MEEAGTCLRCGAPYQPGATVCFTCGAPIGETQTPTQPVRAVIASRPIAPGAPAPASQPAEPAPPPPAIEIDPAYLAATRAPEPVARRRLGFPGIVLVCLVVLAVLGGAAYTIRALTAAPPVAHQTVYRDPQHRFHFERPALWLVTPSADGVTLSDSDGTSTAKISVVVPTTAETAKSYADELAARNSLTATVSQPIAGQDWEQRHGQVTGADGAVREAVIFVTVHDGQLYTIQFTCPVATYDSINNLVYQPLLASFAFS